MEENTNSQALSYVRLLIPAALIWLLPILAVLMPEARLWGFNHLIFLSPAYLYAYVIVGFLILISCLPRFRPYSSVVFEYLADRLFSGKYRAKLALLAVVALGIFWFLRLPVGFLGDGYSLIYNIGDLNPVVFKWSDSGAIGVIYLVSRLLPFSGIELGHYAYAVVSVISGALTVFLFGVTARELDEENSGRLFILGMLLSSGAMLLFFGYVENYPVLWPFITAYLYVSIRYLKGKGSIIFPGVLGLAAIILHLQSLFFILSYFVLIFARDQGEELHRRRRRAVVITLLGLFALGTAAYIWKYQTSIAFRMFVLPLAGRPPVPYYSLLSPTHLLDLFNEMILLLPLFPILLVGTISRWKHLLRFKIECFLGVFTLGGFLFLVMVEPKLGMGRDWDLFALCGLGPLLLLSRIFVGFAGRIKQCYPQMIMLAILLSGPYLLVNTGRSTSLARFEWLMRLDMPRSRSGMTQLYTYFTDIGDTTRADSVRKVSRAEIPSVSLSDRVLQLIDQGNLQEAQAAAETLLALDPYSAEALGFLGVISLKKGNFHKAREELEKAFQIERYNPGITLHLAQACFKLHDYGKAIDYFSRAQELAPDDLIMLDGFASVYFMVQQYDSVMVYAKKALLKDKTYHKGYYLMGMAAYGMRNYDEAGKYLNDFLILEPDNPRKDDIQKILANIGKKK